MAWSVMGTYFSEILKEHENKICFGGFNKEI